MKNLEWTIKLKGDGDGNAFGRIWVKHKKTEFKATIPDVQDDQKFEFIMEQMVKAFGLKKANKILDEIYKCFD